MYVRIEWTHIKVKDTMEQEEISIEKIRKLIRTLEGHSNPHCAYIEILYFQSCIDCPYRALPCWCLLGNNKYILK